MSDPDPGEIKAAREQERASLDMNERQFRALEDIADTLESLRVAYVMFSKGA